MSAKKKNKGGRPTKIIDMEIDGLIPYINNARVHSDNQISQIAASIKEFGFTNPVLLDGQKGVIAGHGRIEAAKKLSIEKVPCIELSHLTEIQKKAYILSDNKLAENATWNEDLISLELQTLKESDFNIDLTGFSLDDIILSENEGLTDDDAIPEDVEPVTKLGDLWVLGEHRVLCGDSTKTDDYELLMNGSKSDIVFTSPPYNAGKTPKENGKYRDNKDSMSKEKYIEFLDTFTKLSLSFSDYVFSNIQSLKGNKIALIEHLYNLKEFYADEIIWDKGSSQPAMARRVLNSTFEHIYVFSQEATRAIGKKDFRGTINNIFQLSSRSDKEFAAVHKATFPVKLPEMFIEWFVETSVLDPFLGTGTTLIACEKTNRKCYGMEIDPHYCDVIVKRWEDYTGKKAELCQDQ